MDVEALAAAIARGDHAAALATALGRWRTHRAAELGDLIDALSARCPRPPLAGRDKGKLQQSFVAAARKDSLADGQLADALLRSVHLPKVSYITPEHDRKKHRYFLARIDALAGREPDPRIARALAAFLAAAPYSVELGRVVYGPVIDLVVALGDERSIAALQAVVDKPSAKIKGVRDYLAGALPTAIEKLATGLGKRPPLDPATRTQLAALTAALVGPAPTPRRMASDIDALLAECLAQPDDDGPREVYADALLEHGDPRGEFIQLQLRAVREELADAEAKRVASLQRKHDKDWLGDIARVTKKRAFRRGFVDEVELLQGAAADPATWAAVAADPRMATVRILHKGSASEELYKKFVMSPALKSLRDIEVPSNQMLRDLVSISRPVDSIVLSAGLTRDALAVLGAVATKAGIRRLAFTTKHPPAALIAQLAAWPDRTKFEELTAMPHHSVGNAWVSGDQQWLFAFDQLAPVTRLGFGDERNRLVLARVGGGVEAEIVADQEWLIVRLLSRRQPLPVTKLVVRGKPAAWFPPGAAFKKAIAKLPAAAVSLREGWASFSDRRGRRE